MPSVPISENEVVALDDLAPGVAGLRIVFVNVFGVAHGDGAWTLVDAGLPFSAAYIRHWAEQRFNGPAQAIVLTHGHFDHVSAAGELAEAWQVPIYAHAREFPYLTGSCCYPEPKTGAGGGLMSLLAPLYPRHPVDLSARLHVLDDRSASIALPGWQVVETPGHTPGHVSLFRPVDGVLLAGDAFCTTKSESFFEAALAQQPELNGPPAYFTWNEEIASASIQKLAALRPETLAPGHGRPLAGQSVADQLQLFASSFAGMPKAA